MKIFIPFILSALAGALASKILLYSIKRNGPFIGLFLSWLFVSLLAMCTPYPFLCALLFGFLFIKVTDAGKIWPYAILATLLYWALHRWFDDVIPVFLSFLGNDLHERWQHVKTLVLVTRQGGVN